MLLVLGCFGTDWISVSEFQKWVALITILAVALSYVLGVIADRLADAMMGWVARCHRVVPVAAEALEPETVEQRDRRWAKEHLMLCIVMKESEDLAKFLDYQRSRMRVARATAVNTVLAVPGLVLLILRAKPSAGVIVFIAIAVMLLAIASRWVSGRRLADPQRIPTRPESRLHRRVPDR